MFADLGVLLKIRGCQDYHGDEIFHMTGQAVEGDQGTTNGLVYL